MQSQVSLSVVLYPGHLETEFLDLVLQPPIWYTHQWCPKCSDGRTISDIIGLSALQTGSTPSLQPRPGAVKDALF